MTDFSHKDSGECEACRIITTGGLAGVGLYLFSIRKEAKNPRLVTALGAVSFILAPLNYYYHKYYRSSVKSPSIDGGLKINK
jgi:hypothetical protein